MENAVIQADNVSPLYAIKDAFAMALLYHPNDPLKAAMEASPNNPDFAVWLSHSWLHDEYVEKKKAELLVKLGAAHFLPSKIELGRKLWSIAETASIEDSDKINALKLYAQVLGMVEGNKVAVNNNVTVQNNRVMVIKDHGSDDAWENKALKQQSMLIEQAKDDV